MKLYKLTDSNDRTYGGCQWGENITHETSGQSEICGPGWTHWYSDPWVAVFLNPVHGEFDLKTAHLWEGEGEMVIHDCELKIGCTKATTLKRIPLPVLTPEQRIEIAIRCVLLVYEEPIFVQWAQKWLSGEDRSMEVIKRVKEIACSREEIAWVGKATEAWWSARAAERATAAAIIFTNLQKDIWAYYREKGELQVAKAAAQAAETATWTKGSKVNLRSVIYEVVKDGKEEF